MPKNGYNVRKLRRRNRRLRRKVKELTQITITTTDTTSSATVDQEEILVTVEVPGTYGHVDHAVHRWTPALQSQRIDVPLTETVWEDLQDRFPQPDGVAEYEGGLRVISWKLNNNAWPSFNLFIRGGAVVTKPESLGALETITLLPSELLDGSIPKPSKAEKRTIEGGTTYYLAWYAAELELEMFLPDGSWHAVIKDMEYSGLFDPPRVLRRVLSDPYIPYSKWEWTPEDEWNDTIEKKVPDPEMIQKFSDGSMVLGWRSHHNNVWPSYEVFMKDGKVMEKPATLSVSLGLINPDAAELPIPSAYRTFVRNHYIAYQFVWWGKELKLWMELYTKDNSENVITAVGYDSNGQRLAYMFGFDDIPIPQGNTYEDRRDFIQWRLNYIRLYGLLPETVWPVLKPYTDGASSIPPPKRDTPVLQPTLTPDPSSFFDR